MAEKGFRLTVLTQEKTTVDKTVGSIIAPGTEGYLGILRDHAPLVTQLMPGKLTVKDLDGNETVYAVSGGFLEVNHNTVTLLADSLELGTEIDLERAEAAAQRARERLARKQTGIDFDRAEIALKRALNRQRVRKGL
jgi:F-type H+-transporting ATPase subunit epsilon